MTKNIYGLFDPKTHNFGDICLLDRDEEFRDGCVELLSNPAIPEYVVNDLVGVCYGYVIFDSDDMYPRFTWTDTPRVIIQGTSPSVVFNRQGRMNESMKEDDNHVEEVEANS